MEGGKERILAPEAFSFSFLFGRLGIQRLGGSIFWSLGGCGKSIRTPKGRRREGTAKMPVSLPFHAPKSLIRLKRKQNIQNQHLWWKKEHIRSKKPNWLFLRPKSLDFWTPCSPDFCCSGPHKPRHAIETSRKRTKEKRRRGKEWAWCCKRIGT